MLWGATFFKATVRDIKRGLDISRKANDLDELRSGGVPLILTNMQWELAPQDLVRSRLDFS